MLAVKYTNRIYTMKENFRLTEGALQSLARGEYVENPIMQILASKQLSAEVESIRVRLLLSDGRNASSYAMLTASRENTLNKDISDNTIVKIKRYETSAVNSGEGVKHVLVLLDLETIVPGRYAKRIGNPECLSNDDIEKINSSEISNEDLSPLPPTVPMNDKIEHGVLDEFASPPLPSTIPLSSSNNGEEKNMVKVKDEPISSSDVETNSSNGTTVSTLLKDNKIQEVNQYKPMDCIKSDDDVNPSTLSPLSNNLQGEGKNIISQITGNSVHSISNLSPYHNRWTIKVRVSNKSAIRIWKNARGGGNFFNLDLIDDSGEIRCTVFNELVDKFYNKIEVEKVYCISKYHIKFADKRFKNINGQFVMCFDKHTVVEECLYAGTSVPQINYNFTNINEILDKEIGTEVDVIGICKEVSELQTIQAKSTGREVKKREVTLIDETNTGVALTLWGEDAENFDGSSHPVIAVKRAKVREFGGAKNISVHSTTFLKINPDVPQSSRLRILYDNGEIQDDISNISFSSLPAGLEIPWLTLKEAQDQHSEDPEKRNYFKTKVTALLFQTTNCLYKACPVEDCKKKLIDLENGMYCCEKCNCDYLNFKYRLMGTIIVRDCTSDMRISTFSPEVEKILETTLDHVCRSAEANPMALADFAEKAAFKQLLMKCYTKKEMFRDKLHLRTVAVKVNDINYKEYNTHLILRINSLLNID